MVKFDKSLQGKLPEIKLISSNNPEFRGKNVPGNCARQTFAKNWALEGEQKYRSMFSIVQRLKSTPQQITQIKLFLYNHRQDYTKKL